MTVDSDPFTTRAPGHYYWIAEFSGDANNKDVKTTCGDPSETSVVARSLPKITTAATVDVATVGDKIKDTATLSGLVKPDGTGKVTFRLYSNHNCEGEPLFESTNPTPGGIHADGPVSSDAYTTKAPGTVFWVARYSGDANNEAVKTDCNAPGESTVVEKASPEISTSATPSVVVGGKIKDTATLEGLFEPDGSGKVTFRLYSNHNCEGVPLFESTNPSPGGISANGPVSSDEYTTEAPGSFFWRARYSGDAHNEAVETGCDAPGERTVVEQAHPGITTSATSTQLVGGNIKDVATLSGLVKPTGTGTVTFSLYRDSECKTEAFSSTSSGIVANGSVPSGEYTANASGTYFWVARYAGDANNKAVSTTCGEAGESSVVEQGQPAITTPATPATPSLTTTPEPSSGVSGSTFKDKAVIGGLVGAQPRGQVSWALYSNKDCSGKVASDGPVSVTGNGSYSTPTGAIPAHAGTYYWVASYSGDPNNSAVSSACAAEPIVVVDPGRASAHGPEACIATTAPVYVTGREIRSVTFFMDGPRRRIGTVEHPDKKGRYLIHIGARDLSSHVHRVEMVVVFEPRSKTGPKTMRVLVARCPPPTPVFTG